MSDAGEFYEAVPSFSRFSEVTDPKHYRRVPDDWCVVITDVVGSTQAIAENRYKEVNMLGASTIVAVLNALNGRKIPFAFGGDGATMLVHQSDIDRLRPALVGAKKLAQTAFGLEVRAGIVPVSELSRAGAIVEVARYEVSPTTTLAMFQGPGIALAEKWVKAKEGLYEVVPREQDAKDTSFEGLSCRWNPIRSKRGEMLSLLVQTLGDSKSSRHIYESVLEEIERIMADVEPPQETKPSGLNKLDSGIRLRNLIAEVRLRTRAKNIFSQPKILLSSLVNYVFVHGSYRLGIKWSGFDPQKYVESVVDNTDFRKFDGTLRMIRDCDRGQRERIEAYLEGERLKGNLVYGIHISDHALMTCMVFDWRNDHVHFIDGDKGGYAMAAKQMKLQLADPTAFKAAA